MRRLLLLGLLLLAACSPEPTPFPVDIPLASTPTELSTEPAQAAAPDRLRYALAANTAGAVADLPLLEQSAELFALDAPVNPSELGSRYDLIAAYGDLPGGERSPVEHRIALIFNSAASPMDSAAVVATLRRAVNPQAVLVTLNITGAAAEAAEAVPLRTLRESMANAGWPDGFDLELVTDGAPGAAQLAASWEALGVTASIRPMADAASLFDSGQAHAALVTWLTSEDRAAWEKRAGVQNVFLLYTLPISYLAVPGLTIRFTPAGWPLAAR